MDLRGAKGTYKGLKKVICDRWSLIKFGNCIKCFVLFEWCNRWKEKKGKNKEGLYEQVRDGRCQLEDLILGILVVAVDQRIDRRL